MGATATATAERPIPAYGARKGDLCGVEIHRTVAQLNGPTLHQTRWVLGEVTHATRDGWVKGVQWTAGGGYPVVELVRYPGCGRIHTPVETVSVIQRDRIWFRAGLLTTTTGQRYETAEQLRQVVRPYMSPEPQR